VKLGDFYRHIVNVGKLRDPRPRSRVKGFEDSGILFGDHSREVRKILVGIDMEAPELVLADRLREKKGVDCVMAHHPEGAALAGLPEVMALQTDILVQVGVSQDTARELMEERMREVSRGVSPANHSRAVDAARILDMPFLCAHTPADNQVAYFLERLCARRKPRTLQAIVDMLLEIPEYRYAREQKTGPVIIAGSPRRAPGRIFVEMTGGTEGHREVYDKLYKAGVRTLISMHLAEDHFRKVKDANLNVIIAGHVSSDTLGMNLLLDGVEKAARERLETVDCSGFRRVRR
jgi:putative NIF3 family GTP cyclohydrolase 1 type 2